MCVRLQQIGCGKARHAAAALLASAVMLFVLLYAGVVPCAAADEAASSSVASSQSSQKDATNQAADGKESGEAEAVSEEGEATDGSTAKDQAASSGPTPIDNPSNIVNPHQTPDNSFLYDTSIDELTKADSSFQGNTVQVMGEVIGDSIVAEQDPGKHWITLETLEEGRASSISVLIDDAFLGLIDSYGDYHTIGTILQVRGTYYLTCPSHEGIMDIHADSIVVVNAGSTIQEPLELAKFVPGLLLVAFGIAISVLFSHLREKEL